eukprot:7927319-Ditylum_brightwellii.AAC.1
MQHYVCHPVGSCVALQIRDQNMRKGKERELYGPAMVRIFLSPYRQWWQLQTDIRRLLGGWKSIGVVMPGLKNSDQ